MQMKRLLEIGLGCNMRYGPGASAKIWKRMFPDVDVHFVEYDQSCIQKYERHILRDNYAVHVGSQDDSFFLENFKANHKFADVIIDDGGHKNSQILISFFALWPIISTSGGVYFVEDFGESAYWWHYLDSQPISEPGTERLGTAHYQFIELVAHLFCHLFVRKYCIDFDAIECHMDICMFRKH